MRTTDPGDGSQLETPGEIGLASIIDSTTTAGYTYFCEALPGTLSSAAKWRIGRLSSAGVMTWANGSARFINVADNRASYTYS